MKIEIDLNDILGDEFGAESLQESIKRQVIDSVTSTVQKGVASKIDEAISMQISESIKNAIETQMPSLIDDLINTEYVPLSKWGDRGSKTTFRNELLKEITNQMTYKKEQYSDKENVFTRSISNVVSEEVKRIEKEYKTTVNEFIGKEAFSLAIKTLKSQLGLDV
jgi:hypothetical protein